MHLLHLTDLHYTLDQPFQMALIDALLKDLKQKVADGFSAGVRYFFG